MGRHKGYIHSKKTKTDISNTLKKGYKSGRIKLNNSHFKKGQKAWNKGTKGIMKAWNKGIYRRGVGRKKGFIISQEHKDKISHGNKGRKLSIEQRKKLSLAKKGKVKWSQESRRKLSLSMTGEKEFKGFRTKLRERIRVSRKYLEWRSAIFKRDNYHCQNCGKNGRLEAHHIIPYSKIIKEFKIKTIEQAIKCKELWDIGNGITYCKECHILLDENFGGKSKQKQLN